MSKKAILIISLVVIFVAGTVFFLLYYSATNEKKETGVTPPTQTIPNLPVDQVQTNTVNNSANKTEIEAAFKQTTNQSITKKTEEVGYQVTRYKDKNNQAIPLDNFSKSIGLSISPSVRSLLRDDNYFSFYCPGTNGKKDFGIAFNVKLFKLYPNLYEDEVSFMKKWENTILKDVYKVVFPGTEFKEADLNQPLNFKDGKYRYANVRLSSGTEISLNYGILEDDIFIASSPKCMDNISNYISPIQP